MLVIFGYKLQKIMKGQNNAWNNVKIQFFESKNKNVDSLSE